MKTKLNGFLTLILALLVQITFAQEKTVTGKVSDASGPLPGVTVIVKGTNIGTQTDFDGNYSINANTGAVLQFSFIGMQTVEKTVETSSTIDVSMTESAEALEEVVVTALGITKEKKALGYATEQVKGDAVNTAKEANFMNSLSGKIAGLDIKKSNALGGSTNIILRGYTSLTGNNQPLFVIDGTPVSNSNTNSGNQQTGRGGYDYGNAASDINPEDIESINVLKGAAASNLYGSRAANGVIIITTKKGKAGKGLGVTVNSGVSFATLDEDTFVKYQNEYGAGYGPYYGSTGYFFDIDVDGDGIDDLTTPFTEDASFGGAFDPNLLVYQWDAFYPESPNYLTATPYIAAKNTPVSLYETGVTLNNSVSLSGANDEGSFRLGYTNLDQTGILPNSSLKRNSFDFNGSYNLSDKLTVGVKSTFTKTDGKGRNGSGYDAGNLMQSFRQWFQVNVDMNDQRDAYFATRRNITWNYSGDPTNPDNLTPIYFDNPYWVLYENYETDTRSRLFGNINLNYEINDNLNLIARTSIDTYSEFQEERTNVGSTDLSSYSRYNRSFEEVNYDLILSYDYDLTDDLSINGVIGSSVLTQRNESIYAATSGGLVVPSLYSLSNSKNLLPPPSESYWEKKLVGVYANASFGYKDTYYLDVSARNDISSALPDAENSYFYPAVSGSLIFSKLIDIDWLSFGKLRANYAEVGNDTGALNVYDTYSSPTNFTVPLFSVNSTKNNDKLKSERTKGSEVGLEMTFLDRRGGFDVAYYYTKSIDQIFPVKVSRATGFTEKFINAGRIDNKGTEISAFVIPVKNDDFQWRINGTWAKNENEVKELFTNETTGAVVTNLQLASVQGGITINAAVGESYGSIWGTNFTYLNGKKVIDPVSGAYVVDAEQQPIGNISPDWKGGITNTFTYKDLTFSFLIDMQKGGDVFSLDTYYGFGTGIYDITAGTNELGNPVRSPVADGGGILLEGVNPDGSVNTTRTRMDYYANALGWTKAPKALHVYDASYVKLREVTLTYKFPSEKLKSLPFTNIVLSAVGRNLWIIDKNMPYSDPEAGLSSGNIQGYQSGAAPSQKEYGFNVRFEF
ncbi:SusC/RagA family TonB-linked outer membrane protein [Lutibacter sp.]